MSVQARDQMNFEREGSKSVVRIASVQYELRQVESFEGFAKNVEHFVRIAADYGADFALFPELFTLQLLSMEPEPVPLDRTVDFLTRFTDPLRTLLSRLAVAHKVNIIGGSHPTLDETGAAVNTCFVCLRDGSVHRRDKIHPTPNERDNWRIAGGSLVEKIETDCGPIGVMICYDSEFPELARRLVDQGADILFVPFCTDERQGYLRVRYCCQARAVENQCCLALSGTVGNLRGVLNMDIQYAQNCIMTPCDFPFARDGIAAEATPNIETVIFADLDRSALHTARRSGTVRNLSDRRTDLYRLEWGPSSGPL